MQFHITEIDDYCQEKPWRVDWNDEFFGQAIKGDSSLGIVSYNYELPPYIITLRAHNSVWKKLKKDHHVIKSEYYDSGTRGWEWIDLTVDDALTWKTVAELIDDSYQILQDCLDDDQKQQVAEDQRKRDPQEILDQAIEENELESKRAEILKLWQPAMMLKTKSVAESRIKLGQSKLGGRPDLPGKFNWPMRDGKPLAFLAQLNFDELPDEPKLRGCPTQGIIYFFSTFGWQVEDEFDPLVGREKWGDRNTQVLYCDSKRAKLTRHKKPKDVNGFPAAKISFQPVRRLPTSVQEPDVAKLKLRGALREQFESLFWDYSYRLDEEANEDGDEETRNFLFGFADDFDKVVSQQKLKLLLQIGSDGNAGMHWGDDGLLYFWIKPSHLSKRNFASIYTGYECG